MSKGELLMVVTILLFVAAAGKLRSFGEWLGSWLYRRGSSRRSGGSPNGPVP